MAGHSKWANIKHRKAKVDAKRGKLWSKCSRAIIVAAKNGGPDPAANLTLRYAIDEARAANMPKDTIERAIKKGAGEGAGESYESIRYEGYGPSGVAVIVECLSDNRNRTAGEIRMIFSKHGGNLGAVGCVGYMFESKGLILIDDGAVSEDKIMDLAISAGAEDVAHEDGVWAVRTAPEDFLSVKGAIEEAGIEMVSSEVTMESETMAELAGEDVAKTVRLIDALEDNDDVQKVYTNMDASEADLDAAMA
ncbi:MAG: YebC/PmpR family DNA-binding transcriptional regulator [Phycisphaeraceae bacterium]|nr:YebC/PmpR family DNA-binding transcriptional regulator [Phycisphaerales bacterium]MCB9843751.1 YebC/PmpR family DNA-binding transcriptional regulator [Phycisphaeraceae bacterium]